MVNFLTWNARGLGKAVKRRLVSDYLKAHSIDIIGILETKKESFTSRMLNNLSSNMSQWFQRPSLGLSGGILVGFDGSKFDLVNHWIGAFTISLHFKNKSDHFEWIYTVVYGPVLSSKRLAFFTELRLIHSYGIAAWLLTGDFNLIRYRQEKIGPSFNIALSNRFNSLISTLQLLEISLYDRKFTWSKSINSTSQALLDRVFCSVEWVSHYPAHNLTSLPRFMSDHNPLLLQTSAPIFNSTAPIRFERTWLAQEGFIALLTSWWQSFPLGHDLGKDWQVKLQFLRRKLRGWHTNVMGAQNKQKKHLLSQISKFEELDESNSLSSQDMESWQNCQSTLHQLYLDEETYWQQRSRLKWFLEGDLNTKFFHVTASTRKRKKYNFLFRN